MVAAGYDPSAFYSFFGRLTESEAKGGGWFSDLFSTGV
jgi:predicted Zn-dependent protease